MCKTPLFIFAVVACVMLAVLVAPSTGQYVVSGYPYAHAYDYPYSVYGGYAYAPYGAHGYYGPYLKK